MPHTRKTGLVALLAAAAAFTATGTARANDGAAPQIHALIQEGQAVEVTVSISDSGEPGFERRYRLERATDEGRRVLFTDRSFDPEDAASSWGFCHHETSPDCAEEDMRDECEDCDGDGVPESLYCGPCETLHDFPILDPCVPPGAATYRILDERGEEHDSRTITVSEHGAECPAEGAAGCSAAGGGASRGAAAGAALLMLALGAVAARRRG